MKRNGKKDGSAIESKHIVIVDGDGAAMGINYYRRRDALGLGLRGEGANENREAFVSEGVVITWSESLARQMYMLAAETIEKVKAENPDRNPTVSIGTVYLRPFEEKPPDRQLRESLKAIFSRRGRKPKSSDWHVRCQECELMWDEASVQPLKCPDCGGLMLNWEPTKLIIFDVE